MVKIHVWLQDPIHVGHVALAVKNIYVSFWPDGAASKKDIKIKRSQPGTFVESLLEDIRNEGGRAPITVELNGLDEEKLVRYLEDMKDSLPNYQLARNNCSHVVVHALIDGAGCKPSFTPHAGAYHVLGRILGIGIWTPDQVLKFAMELREGPRST